MMNERGEIALVILVFATVIGSSVALKEKEREHKKAMHYEQYHKEAVKKQKDLEEELGKAKLYQI